MKGEPVHGITYSRTSFLAPPARTQGKGFERLWMPKTRCEHIKKGENSWSSWAGGMRMWGLPMTRIGPWGESLSNKNKELKHLFKATIPKSRRTGAERGTIGVRGVVGALHHDVQVGFVHSHIGQGTLSLKAGKTSKFWKPPHRLLLLHIHVENLITIKIKHKLAWFLRFQIELSLDDHMILWKDKKGGQGGTQERKMERNPGCEMHMCGQGWWKERARREGGVMESRDELEDKTCMEGHSCWTELGVERQRDSVWAEGN